MLNVFIINLRKKFEMSFLCSNAFCCIETNEFRKNYYLLPSKWGNKKKFHFWPGYFFEKILFIFAPFNIKENSD